MVTEQWIETQLASGKTADELRAILRDSTTDLRILNIVLVQKGLSSVPEALTPPHTH